MARRVQERQIKGTDWLLLCVLRSLFDHQLLLRLQLYWTRQLCPLRTWLSWLLMEVALLFPPLLLPQPGPGKSVQTQSLLSHPVTT